MEATTAKKYEGDETTRAFFKNSTAKRVNTDALIASALTKQYPNLELVIVPSYGVDLLGFASSGHASYTLLENDNDSLPSSLIWKTYMPPARRLDGNPGGLAQEVSFAKLMYKWKDFELILYMVDGRDGTQAWPNVRNSYLLTTDTHKAEALIVAAGQWTNELHEEVWVWDGGYWQKSAELYHSVMKASWDAVILDKEMKDAIINDHLSFFDSRDAYEELKVPWKRGLIYYGPPGNGKTISIKAMMHTLYTQKDPIPTLYVRNFSSWAGPEAAISAIFSLARQTAPCYLIFEDLDSLVTDQVRSYFLNEIDGLKSNDGIFIVGSTNHLDRLDPGIAKRPSRFDRLYLFPDPDFKQRVAYCKFWQAKLADNKKIEFPDELCEAIADITHDFSFAYIQEAFVAALLVIASAGKDKRLFKGKAAAGAGDEDDDEWVVTSSSKRDDLEDLELWVEIQRQVAILRESIGKETSSKKLAIRSK
ncbi:P-loop containing nucleoside triphosphate hydrolase protein [Cercophora newfieldiana]|uniref:P-loop containing nucleoside triphosphate hydrolase protein n=1 Tax=Cercophora newfieldiana TaxID=92897 RepID=A0AA39Y497_9PEZI|nr:P-loop containing nucleoside triphosphate hydrolase protein [Cercophora newfieldiana]